MRKNGKVRYDNKGRKLPDNITQRKNGLYQVRLTIDGKQWVKYNQDLGEAKKILRKKQAEIAEGFITNLEALRLDDWYDRWLQNYKKPKLKQRSYNNYVGYYNRYIRNTKIGRMKLEEIRQIHLINHYNGLADRADKPLAHSTLVYINSMIGGCFQEAMVNGLIKNNPAVGAMQHVGGHEEKERIALSEEEVQKFLEFISYGRYAMYKNMFTVLFRTGVRIGELLSLTWDDIYLDQGKIIIDKSVNYDKLDGGTKKEFFITPPKTKNSIREIPMRPSVKVALVEQKTLQEVFGISNDYEVKRFDKDKRFIGMCRGFVFTTSKGTIPTNESVNRTIEAILNTYNKIETQKASEEKREPKLLPWFTMHSTRHTFATDAYRKNMRGKSVAGIMGHSREETSKETYTHPDFDDLKKDMEGAWEI